MYTKTNNINKFGADELKKIGASIIDVKLPSLALGDIASERLTRYINFFIGFYEESIMDPDDDGTTLDHVSKDVFDLVLLFDGYLTSLIATPSEWVDLSIPLIDHVNELYCNLVVDHSSEFVYELGHCVISLRTIIDFKINPNIVIK